MSLYAGDITCTNAEFSTLAEAIDGCAQIGELCIVDRDLETATATADDIKFKCETVSAGAYVPPEEVKINGSKARRLQGGSVREATAEEVNKQLCLIYGAHYGTRENSFWTADQSNNLCIEAYASASSCTDFADFATVDPIIKADATSADFLPLCEKMVFLDGDSATSRCKAPQSGDACELDLVLGCTSTETAGTKLDEKIDGCKAAWTVEGEGECLINFDQSPGEDQCVEYIAGRVVQANEIVFGSVQSGDSTRCVLLQQVFSELGGSTTGWMKKDGSAGCAEATTCESITVDDWADAISTTKPEGTLCKALADVASTACDGEAADATCKEMSIANCSAAGFDDVRTALDQCGSDVYVTLPAPPKVCAMSADLSSPAYESGSVSCQEYDDEDGMITGLGSIQTTALNEIRNNVVCLATGIKIHADAETNAFISDESNTSCEAATSCTDIVFSAVGQDYAGTGYTKESFKSAFPCTEFQVEGSVCIEGDDACSSAPVVECSSVIIPQGLTLKAAISLCTSASPDDAANECRIGEDLSTTYTCENKAIATKMVAADVKVVDQASSDAVCAAMGHMYGEKEIDAWKRTGGVCEAIVLEGSCTEVTWKEADSSSLGAFSWQEVCTSIGHKGYTDADGTEGLVTCQYTENAEACSSAVALVMGVVSVIFTMFF